ncbi:MAG: sensory histidine kinase AtoS [Methanomassiliicoccales archaeon PtaU1.Bin124]|nr:MAG: sensory histidine kinase AtoS [Methanomassiliicoccales archaeon PtaU1.Bin124]
MNELILCLGRDLQEMEGSLKSLSTHGWSVRLLHDPAEVFPIIIKEDVSGVVVFHGGDVDALTLLPRWRVFAPTIPFFVITGEGRDRLAAALVNQDHTYVFLQSNELEWCEVVHRLLGPADSTELGHVPSTDARLWEVMGEAADWIWTTDREGHMTYSSPGTRRLFGYDASEVLGRGIWELVPEIDREGVRTAWTGAVAERRPLRDFHLKLIASDGKARGMMMHAVPMTSPDGEFSGMVCVCMDETQRLAAYEMALAEEENYRSLLESLPNPVVVTDPDGKILMVNIATSKLFGHNTAELVGTSIFRHLPEEDRQRARRDIAMVLSGGKEGPKRYHIFPPDGQRTIEVTSSIQHDADGKVTRIVLVVRDVTDEDRLRRELEDSRSRIQSIMESVPAVAFELDRDLCFTFIGPNADRLWGFPAEEVIGTSPFDYLELGEKVKAISSVERFIYDRLPFDGLIVRVKRPDGKVDHLEVGGRPFYDQNNVFQGYQGVAREVTKRVEMERELKKAEEMYRLLAFNMNDAVWTCDLDMNMTYVSPSMRRHMRMGMRDDVQGYLVRAVEESTQQNMLRARDELLAEHGPGKEDNYRIIETKVQLPGEPPMWIEQKISLMLDMNGRPVGLIGVARDVTESKLLLRKLTNAERSAWSLFERGPDAMYILDLHSDKPHILMANDKAVRETGYSLDEFQGMPLRDLVMEVGPNDVRDWVDAIGREMSIVVERPQRRKDGTFHDVQATLSFVTLDDRQMILGLVRDVTEQHKNIRLLERRNRELVALNRMIQSCSYVASEEELLRLTLDLVAEAGEFDVSVLILVDESGKAYLADQRGLDTGAVEYLKADPTMLDEIVSYMADGEPLFMADVASISTRAKTWGIESFVALPVLSDDRIIAVLVYTSTAVKEIPMSDRHLMTSVWRQLQDTVMALELKRQTNG